MFYCHHRQNCIFTPENLYYIKLIWILFSDVLKAIPCSILPYICITWPYLYEESNMNQIHIYKTILAPQKCVGNLGDIYLNASYWPGHHIKQPLERKNIPNNGCLHLIQSKNWRMKMCSTSVGKYVSFPPGRSLHKVLFSRGQGWHQWSHFLKGREIATHFLLLLCCGYSVFERWNNSWLVYVKAMPKCFWPDCTPALLPYWAIFSSACSTPLLLPLSQRRLDEPGLFKFFFEFLYFILSLPQLYRGILNKWNCMYLRQTMWCFIIDAHGEVNVTVKVLNIFLIAHWDDCVCVYLCVCIARILRLKTRSVLHSVSVLLIVS